MNRGATLRRAARASLGNMESRWYLERHVVHYADAASKFHALYSHYTFPGRAGSRSRALARRNYTVPRRRMDGGTPRRDTYVYVRVAPRLRTYVRVCAREPCGEPATILISTFLTYAFSFPWRFYRATAAHLPTLTRNARGVYRFYHETSVFTFRYNYTLMRGDRRIGSGFAWYTQSMTGRVRYPSPPLSHPSRRDQHARYDERSIPCLFVPCCPVSLLNDMLYGVINNNQLPLMRDPRKRKKNMCHDD